MIFDRMGQPIAFHEVFPQLAKQETWQFTPLFEETPSGCYSIIEYYCPDPKCQCHMAQLAIADKDQILATFSYGWKGKSHYRYPLINLPGLDLNPYGLQSKFARALWKELNHRFLKNKTFTKMLKSHYEILKQSHQLINTIAKSTLAKPNIQNLECG